jgi:enolase-phosphatase E1
VSVPLRNVDAKRVRALLLDIEGTTTPIDFVYKTLFPYASRKVESFLQDRFGDAEIRSLVRDLQAQHEADEANGLRPPPAWRTDTEEHRIRCAGEYVRWLIARDSKCTPLKSLQGKIWQQGFEAGELHGEVYEDVPRAFARWRGQGRQICIYSSGSVLAQQLLFRTVASGDLTPYLTAFFDTQTGMKTVAESYRKIATSLDLAPHAFLFISDAAKEIDAALASGMQALMCDRREPPPAIRNDVRTIHDFDEVPPD